VRLRRILCLDFGLSSCLFRSCTLGAGAKDQGRHHACIHCNQIHERETKPGKWPANATTIQVAPDERSQDGVGEVYERAGAGKVRSYRSSGPAELLQVLSEGDACAKGS